MTPSTTTEAGRRTLMTPEQAAALLGVHVMTLAKWRMSGTGPAYLKLNARVRYDRADVNSWLSEARRQSTADRGPASPSAA